MNRLTIMLSACLLLAAGAPAASGATILQNTGGSLGVVSGFFGESFTTPAGGPWSSVAFNFYSDIPATTPTAAGTAFLLTQEYLGTPAGLGTALPGFLAQSTGVSGGQYNFAPTLVLQPNVKYFLYENASLNTSGGNSITGGNAYFAALSSNNFVTAVIPSSTALQASNFLLTGTPLATVVPEPASLVTLSLGLAAVAGIVWRRFA